MFRLTPRWTADSRLRVRGSVPSQGESGFAGDRGWASAAGKSPARLALFSEEIPVDRHEAEAPDFGNLIEVIEAVLQAA